MPSSIPRTRSHSPRDRVKTTSLRALVVAARLERNHAPEGPPGKEDGRAEQDTRRPTPDPA
ncbi:hypothetical protein BZB76_5034 [Actinomadura pelletieri DSM 43383]|uniref:Uncharacterized protein n=1 Tax=Actinomadura pelletieri DSM 43383 TaxID=1120940 RepID=A0A495QJ84_9ACTN|nr:hypothetical protein [Actinomadura pelletieri]RKS72213.1 hypothetical protein BZB76_5034 [Actinomadura pelletieri DSM 43383]